eukprot:TRINITY_DN87_c0_g1_i2.p2 TRINITY_DN87_c0_g1~~TRINITY_DN87_c0_g1_i2.p2  ORF type:complete len:105 (+),score=8.28 TRINITY_DN87_c0_g1_i2:191-505(+)
MHVFQTHFIFLNLHFFLLLFLFNAYRFFSWTWCRPFCCSCCSWFLVGLDVGHLVGVDVVGLFVGPFVGHCVVGIFVGHSVGVLVGDDVGHFVVGFLVGFFVGHF